MDEHKVRSTDLTQATSYFDRFVKEFASFDGKRVADLFVTPVVALRSDGSLIGLPNRDDVVHYYQTALDKYHSDGCRSCQWSELSVTQMGVRSQLATVTWDLLRNDGTVVARWRQSYGLSLFGDHGPKAFCAVSHTEN
jgi:hypothetical protein